MDRVKSFVNKNKTDINLTNITNTFQNFKTKVSNISFNNNSKEQNNSELVGSRSVRSTTSSNNGLGATNFVRNFSTNFFSNKENVNTNNYRSNTNKAFSNLNAKDVSKVSGFAANHPAIAKRGLQAAAYASGDKEMAKKIGQTSNKDIASTASKINKGANFVVENQDKIDEFNNTMDKLNRGDKNNGSSPVNKFVNSSAISNSNSNSGTHYNLPKRSSTISTVPSGGGGGGSSKISAPPPLPGRINNDVHITRNNSTSSTGSTPRTEKIVRSNTVGSSGNTNIPSTTKFNKPPPPPVPRHKPDLDKMTEVITSSASNTTSRSVNAPPPLPHRPSASKLKKSDSDSKLFNEGNSNEPKGKSIACGNTQPSSHAPGIKTQSYNNDCANEITRDFNISMPPDNISRYSNVFIQVAENNVVTDSTVKALWMQSGIPKSVLAKIWSFVNRKLDGLLEKSEFIVGMYIIDQYLNGYDIEYYFMDQ